MFKKQKILLLHGWGGSDFPHWQSWLAGELAKDYGCVSFLKFSEPDFPKLDVWKMELKEHLKDFKPDIVLCHSLANTLWFHICKDDDMDAIRKLYLVAPPRINCEIEELKSFFPVKIPKELKAKKALIISSTNDPYLSENEAKSLQKKLNIEMKVLQNAGHINSDSGYGKWNWILQDIKKD